MFFLRLSLCQIQILLGPTRRANAQTTHFHMCKIRKTVLFMSLKYTQVTQSILCWIFLVCVATMHHLTTVDKKLKAVYDSNIRVTLK